MAGSQQHPTTTRRPELRPLRTARRALLVTASATAALFICAAAAAAQANGGGIGEVNQGSSGAVQVGAASWVDGNTIEGGGSCPQGSSSSVAIADDFASPVYPATRGGGVNGFVSAPAGAGIDPSIRLFAPSGVWYLYTCGGAGLYFLPGGGPAVTIPGLVDQAVALLDPPDPPLAVTPDHGRHLVQLPSWLAIEPAYWAENRVRTVNAGRVEVTATLTPLHMDWDPGNGDDPPPCTNPGTIWRSGMSEDQSDCSYTYTQPSINPPNNTWDLAGTIVFEVTHATNAPGVYGPWVPVERTSIIEDIEVLEIQAVSRPNPSP